MIPPGYQYHPVLSEKELLSVQSPNYRRNIFKTSVIDILVDSNSFNEISLVFRTVADVNTFLFEVFNSKGPRTLGDLKENARDLILKPRQGQFVLLSEDDPGLLDGLREKFQFELTDSDGGSALKFEDKLKMFVFLFSQQGKNLQQLTIDQSQIVNKVESTIDGLKEDENENIVKKVDSDQVEENNNDDIKANIEASEITPTETEQNQEIEGLKAELRAKDETIERKINQQKKMEKRFYELQSQIQQIASICSSAINHEFRDL